MKFTAWSKRSSKGQSKGCLLGTSSLIKVGTFDATYASNGGILRRNRGAMLLCPFQILKNFQTSLYPLHSRDTVILLKKGLCFLVTIGCLERHNRKAETHYVLITQREPLDPWLPIRSRTDPET